MKTNGLHNLRDLYRQRITEREQMNTTNDYEDDDTQDDDNEQRNSHKVTLDGKIRKKKTWNDAQLKIIGNHIRKIRQLRGVTQSELEKKCKLKLNYMSHIEAGKWKGFDRENLKAIEQHLKDDFTDFLLELERKNVVIAEPSSYEGHSFKRKRIHSEELSGDDFTIQYEVNNDDFTLNIITKDNMGLTLVTQGYKGKKFRQHPFLDAMEEAVKMIRKAI